MTPVNTKAADILDVYSRSPKGLNGYAKVSKAVSRFVLEVHNRHEGLFDILSDDDCLEIKLTDYGKAFYDGIQAYRKEKA